ncbi:unnamed protein product [Leptidea sinapis]|uniref:Sec16 Sec23-binding domain-containing protein n=1 Tax=Leptidea sinapis TaxID=189913 RepID=A0A5E4PNV5_9NEOP|nr:unnamed protein product [Leptidea sinapis]
MSKFYYNFTISIYISEGELTTDASLNLHLEESTVRSERMTPFKYSTAHIKVIMGTDIAELLMKNSKEYQHTESPASDSGSRGATAVVSDPRDPPSSAPAETLPHSEASRTGVENERNASGLWGHALQLASFCERRVRASVTARFLAALPPADPLHTLYSALAARAPPAATCVSDERWGDWRVHAAMILANPSAKPDQDRRTLTQIGDSLASRGLIYSSQFCYLTAGVPFTPHPLAPFTPRDSAPSAPPRLSLLLADPRATTLASFASDEAIFATEIYEYAISLKYFDPALAEGAAEEAGACAIEGGEEGAGSGEPSPRHQQWVTDIQHVVDTQASVPPPPVPTYEPYELREEAPYPAQYGQTVDAAPDPAQTYPEPYAWPQDTHYGYQDGYGDNGPAEEPPRAIRLPGAAPSRPHLYDDDVRPPSADQTDRESETPKPSSKGTEGGKAEDGGKKGGGWFGGILNKLSLRPPNQMILPDDKNPTIVWDENTKRWVNRDGGSDDVTQPLPPPPAAPPALLERRVMHPVNTEISSPITEYYKVFITTTRNIRSLKSEVKIKSFRNS